jgi:hypothetical protein
MSRGLLESRIPKNRLQVRWAVLWQSGCIHLSRALIRVMNAKRLKGVGKVSERLGGRSQLRQYIVAVPGRGTMTPLRDLLDLYSGINILQQLDPATGLVEMSEDTARQLSADHPEILIEQNIRYAMQALH